MSLNYKSDHITMNCIDLMSKRSKTLRYVIKHSKLRKTTKEIKLQWTASIWHQNNQKCWVTSQNIQNNANLQNWSNYNEFQSIWRQNYQNIWVRSQNYKSNQITINCIDLTRKRSKMLSYVAKHSKQRKTTKLIKLQWIASIWCQNYQKCWGTSQNIQNYAKLQKKSNYNELHRFDVKSIKTTKLISFRRICIELTSKRSKTLRYVAKHSKQRKSTKLIKLQWIASIWCQNNQKTQNYKSNQITINLYRFDAKMLSYVAKHSKQRKTTKMIKL